MRADLDVGPLYRIMQRLGELRSNYPNFTRSADFLDLVPGGTQSGTGREPAMQQLLIIDRHISFLEKAGFVDVGNRTMNGVLGRIELTVSGEYFVQPELAEFGRPPILPQVVAYIEDKIEISQRPKEEKAGLKFKLREALAGGTADLFAKVLVEAISKMAGL